MPFNLLGGTPLTPTNTGARPAFGTGNLNVRPSIVSGTPASNLNIPRPTYTPATPANLSTPATVYSPRPVGTNLTPTYTPATIYSPRPVQPTINTPGLTLPSNTLPPLPIIPGNSPIRPAWSPNPTATPASTADPQINNPALIAALGGGGAWSPPTTPFFDPMGAAAASSAAQTPPNVLPPAITAVTPQTPGFQAPQPSLEQLALGGGGASNKQQISNFMTALNNVGAGSNNTFMNAPTTQTAPIQNLVNPNVANQNTGSAGAYNAGVGGYTNVQQPSYTAPAAPGGAGAGLTLPTNTLPTLPPPGYTAPTTDPSGLTGFQALLNQISNSVGSLGGIVSDQNLKTNIQPADEKLNQFLQSIKAHSYQYKDPTMPGAGPGTYVSPMAQELEKTELGKQAVIDTPQGKMVNYGRLTGVNLAAVSVVHREQQRLQNQVQQLRKQVNILKRGK